MKQTRPDSSLTPSHFNREHWWWLFNNRCKGHGHRYTSHMNCLYKDYDVEEKIGFLDIEASNLAANFGVMLSYCILCDDGKTVHGRFITPKELHSKTLDKQIVADCVQDMLKFDRLVVHYGTDRRYDFPFIRTRCVRWGIHFPEYGTLKVTDTYPMARNKLKLHSNRQNVITELYEGASDKTRVIGELWTRALQGNVSALKEIYHHNVIDVKELRKNYWKLVPYVRKANTSI